MKQLKIVLSAAIVIFLTACSGGKKTVLIMASGKVSVDAADNKNITLVPGSTHTEKEVVLDGGEKETITVKGGADGNKTFDLNEAGNYVLNLKQDTLIGGIVNYGTGGRTSNLTGEDVDRIIDSTQKLLLGQNVSDESKTYFIPPFTIKKVSANADAKIVGPYNGIPSSIGVGEGGKAPEMYKLFTTKQKRESLEDLIKERKK